MGDKSKIEWTDATWNPVTGCSKVSQGCKFCYAERDFARPYPGRAFTDVRMHPDRLDQPLHWKRPRKIFVDSMSDIFHESIPFGFVMRCLNVMAQTPHTYQILTKRAARMLDFFNRWADLAGEDFEPKLARGPEATRIAHPSGRGQLFADMLESMGTPPAGAAYPTFDWMQGMIRWPLWFRNIWLGVSVEDQKTADERIPLLLQTPAAVRWVSYEPALGPVNFLPSGALIENQKYPDGVETWSKEEQDGWFQGTARATYISRQIGIDWIVAGGESGPRARPSHPDWFRAVRDQCQAAGVPFFFKQWGEWKPFSTVDGFQESPLGEYDVTPQQHGKRTFYLNFEKAGKKRAGRLLDSREWNEFPKAER